MLSCIGPILFIVSGKYYRTVKWEGGRGIKTLSAFRSGFMIPWVVV